MVFTLNQLEIFTAIAKHSSISKAASELGVSQPSISLQIKHLENEFQVKLHRRTGRSIELTAQGRDFLAHARKILAEFEQLQRSFKGNAKSAAVENDPLVVGGSYNISAILLPSALQTFTRRHPDVRLHLEVGPREKLAQMVVKSKVDIAVINDAFESPLLVAEPYRWEKIAVFVPTHHSLAKKSRLELSDILRSPLVIGVAKTPNSTLARIISHAVEEAGVRVSLHCNSPLGVKAAVRQGIGVGILYEDTVRREVDNGDFKVLKFPGSASWGCFSHIVYRREKPLSPAAEKFLAILREKKAGGKNAYNPPKGLELTFPDRSSNV